MTPESEEDWDEVVDVVVVGTGAAGFAAAITAALEGASVVLLEKADDIGGTTAKSGAYYWIPNNRFMQQAGMPDPREEAIRYMARLAFPQFYDPDGAQLGLPLDEYALIETFYDRGSEAVDYFVDREVIRVAPNFEAPDYGADLEENAAPYGRHLFHGNLSDQPFGAPPTRQDTSGVSRGRGFIDQFAGVAQGLGIKILLGHRVVDIIRNASEEVIGVEARVRTRTAIVRARRGVVFASGGFAQNPELRTAFLRGPCFGGSAAETNTGDLVQMATRVGAQMGNMAHAWWDQTPLEVVLRVPATIRDNLFPFGDSMIQVNRFGRRVVNEKMVYNERSQAHFEWDATRREYRNLLLFQIYDEAVAMTAMAGFDRSPVPLPYDRVDYVVSGNTWDELVQNLSDRVQSLAPHTGGVELAPEFGATLHETVERFNHFAETGHDEEFGRGASPIEQKWQGPGRFPDMENPTMFPFSEQGPYHAIILVAGALDTKGGPKIDTSARIIGRDRQPIPGLFGAGNCIASPAGQAYWSAGATIGLALTFGYIAGKASAAAPITAAD